MWSGSASRLAEGGYDGDLLLLHSGGGVMTPHSAQRLAVRLAASGIAAGAIASRHLAGLCGYANAIGLDMGGTSTDISLVYDGQARMTKEWFVEYGYPICFPSIEVLTIGAGGGSLAWIDEAGSLRNGPQSAGADPGPACYGRGNDAADEHRRERRARTARRGADRRRDAARPRPRPSRPSSPVSAEPLGLELDEAANAIIQVANANMADAVRLISIRRGYDPREFALVVFGGAGPLHGAALAKELSIPTVLVPPNPGITSALGCLLVDVRHDLSTMFLAAVDDVDTAQLESEFATLEAEARERLEHENVPADADAPAADDRHALPGPVAIAVDPRRLAARPRRGDVRASTPSTSASTTTAATTRPSRSTGSACRRSGVTPKPELARHARDGALPAAADDAAGSLRRRLRRTRRPCISRASSLPARLSRALPSSTSSTRRPSSRPAGTRRWTSGCNIRMHDTEATR